MYEHDQILPEDLFAVIDDSPLDSRDWRPTWMGYLPDSVESQWSSLSFESRLVAMDFAKEIERNELSMLH